MTLMLLYCILLGLELEVGGFLVVSPPAAEFCSTELASDPYMLYRTLCEIEGNRRARSERRTKVQKGNHMQNVK